MKTLFLTVLSAVFALCSCSEDEDTVKAEIKIDTPVVNLSTPDAGSATTRFTVNVPWNLTLGDPAPTWFTVDKVSGEAGPQTLTITVKEPNLSYTDERKGVLTIKAGDQTGTITIVQPVKLAVEEKQTWTETEYTLQTPKEKGNILISVPTDITGAAKLIIPSGLNAEDYPSITIELAEGASFTGSLSVENADYAGMVTLRSVDNEHLAIGTTAVSTENLLSVNLPKGSFTFQSGKINGSVKATTNPDTFILNGVIEGDLVIEGGSLIIGPTGKVKGSIIMKGDGSLLVEGTVEGTITGGDITIGSTGVTGDIVVTEDGKIKVNEGAQVNGSIDASKAKEADIAEGTVSGEVIPPVNPEKPIAVESISLTEPMIGLVKGSTKQLVFRIAPLAATNQNVTWKSSVDAVATVSATGLVTAKTVGTATITVTTADGNKTATCTVMVTAESVAVTSVTLDKTAASLLVGATETLTATVNPTNATNKTVTWSSSNAAIATVSDKGVVTAKAAGTATITVTTADGNKTATCSVTVTEKPVEIVVVTGVSLDKTSATLVRAKTEALTATVNPTNATNKAVTWTSSDDAIVSVDAKGNVTGVKVGTATITVTTTDGGKTAACTITVIDPANPGGITADSWGNETGGSLNTH